MVPLVPRFVMSCFRTTCSKSMKTQVAATCLMRWEFVTCKQQKSARTVCFLTTFLLAWTEKAQRCLGGAACGALGADCTGKEKAGSAMAGEIHAQERRVMQLGQAMGTSDARVRTNRMHSSHAIVLLKAEASLKSQGIHAYNPLFPIPYNVLTDRQFQQTNFAFLRPVDDASWLLGKAFLTGS